MIKKLILNLALVFSTVFILDFTIGRVIRHFYFTQKSGDNYRTMYAMEIMNADVTVFGSSHANHHYVPKVFEDSLKLTFYNAGRDGQGIFYHLAILRSVLKRYTPKIIILDYSESFKDDKHDYDKIACLLPFYRTNMEIRSIVELRSPYEKIKLFSEIYPFNSEVLTTAIANLDYNKKRRPDSKGYLPLFEKWQGKIDSVYSYGSYNSSQLDSNKVNAFKEFVSTAKSAGAQVYVISSPIFIKFFKNQDIEMANVICASENVQFLDYSKDNNFLNNNQLFGDAGHLNDYGAQLFSRMVVKRIKNNISK